MTDKRIIRLFKNCDEDALRAVMKKYGQLCIDIASENTSSREEAEECVNDALIELWHHVGEDLPRDLPAYIAATVLGCATGKRNIASEAYKKYANRLKIKHSLAFAAAAAIIILLIPAIGLLPMSTTAEDTLPADTDPITDTVEAAEETTAPQLESDGTPGLLYEICEDGVSARFIGFGECEEETVRIASTYGGLPVTEMILGELWALASNEDYQIKSLLDFGSEHLKHLIISDTVEVVGNEIISSCANIESVYYGKSVRELGKSWLTGNKTHQKFSTMEVSPENELYVSIGNCIIDRATKTLVRGCKGSVIPDDGSVEIIGKGAFSWVLGLTSVNIPESVTVIENQAFYGCSQLKEIKLPANLQSLGEEVFYFCTGLVSVDLNGYTVLPKAAFKHCGRLEVLTGSENLTEIGEEALANCSKLKLTLGTSLKKICKYGFLNFASNFYYQGTKAEWNAIEKDVYWAAHSRAGGKLQIIICTNGGIEVSTAMVDD